MAKTDQGDQVKLQMPAGRRTPAPPVGRRSASTASTSWSSARRSTRARRQAGLDHPGGDHGLRDRSFTFITKTPPASVLLKQAAGLAKGSGEPNRKKVGKVTRAQVREIAEAKMPDLNADDSRRPMRMVAGTARSMGIERRGLDPAVDRHRRIGEARSPVGAPPARMKHDGEARQDDRAAARSRSAEDTLATRQARQDCATAKFDETVEVSSHLGVDPRHADQLVRGTVVLPHGTGKTVRVLVFAKGEKEREARGRRRGLRRRRRVRRRRSRKAGLDFDAIVATPDMMGEVGKLGRVLGPRGLMPNPKSGTVTFDVAKAVQRAQGRQDRVPRRQGRATSTPRSARPRSPRSKLLENAARVPARARARQAGGGQGRSTSRAVDARAPRWARASRIDPTVVSARRGLSRSEENTMPTAEKERARRGRVASASAASQGIYLADFTRHDVDECPSCARSAARQSVEYRVVKNTLAKRALDAHGITALDEYLEGPTGIAFCRATRSAPAKVLADFAKEHDKPRIKAGVVDGSAVRRRGASSRSPTLPARACCWPSCWRPSSRPLTQFLAAIDAHRWRRRAQWSACCDASGKKASSVSSARTLRVRNRAAIDRRHRKENRPWSTSIEQARSTSSAT